MKWIIDTAYNLDCPSNLVGVFHFVIYNYGPQSCEIPKILPYGYRAIILIRNCSAGNFDTVQCSCGTYLAALNAG